MQETAYYVCQVVFELKKTISIKGNSPAWFPIDSLFKIFTWEFEFEWNALKVLNSIYFFMLTLQGQKKGFVCVREIYRDREGEGEWGWEKGREGERDKWKKEREKNKREV